MYFKNVFNKFSDILLSQYIRNEEMYCKSLSITQKKAKVINNLSIYKYLTTYINHLILFDFLGGRIID